MGSPVSAVVANLYMQFFEEMAISSAPIKPKLWKRYVDDVFCIIKRGGENSLLSHLNSLRPSIKFTVEREEDGSLAFLDCNLHRADENKISVSVYRKPTHTDKYLHYESHHPMHVKRGVVKSLYDRARSRGGCARVIKRHVTTLTSASYCIENSTQFNFCATFSNLLWNAV